MLAFFKTLLGTPYSEKSPPGSYADGHIWVPGDGRPNHLDCSGATHYVVRETTGIDIDQGNPGNAEGQWNRWAPLRQTVPAPGDLLFFIAGGSRTAPGHTGMCVTFNAANGSGTYISAYDTAEGLVIKPFTVHADWVGAVRIANLLPAQLSPPPPVPVPAAPPAAVAYAKSQNMVEVDAAEVALALQHGISYYVWRQGSMVPSRQAQLPTGTVMWAFRQNLDANHIPHAGP